MKKTAIDVILDEHRALESVLTALRELVDGVADGRPAPDAKVCSAMVEFVTEFPNQIHHRKENEHLFGLLRAQVPGAAALVDRLERDHAELPARAAELERALIHYTNAGAAGLEAFRAQVHEYADFLWRHFLTEERELLPLVKEKLDAVMLDKVDAAFLADSGLWNNSAKEFHDLFEQIVALAPSPLGFGGKAD